MHRRFLFIDIIAALVVLGGIAAVGVVVVHHGGAPAATPFPTQQLTQTAAPSPLPSSAAALLALGDWPTYGYNAARTRFNPLIGLRPPYHVKWRFKAAALLEFPPSIFAGSLYFCTQHGHVYCLDAATGRIRWRFRLGAKSASTPAVAGQASSSAWYRRTPKWFVGYLASRLGGQPRFAKMIVKLDHIVKGFSRERAPGGNHRAGRSHEREPAGRRRRRRAHLLDLLERAGLQCCLQRLSLLTSPDEPRQPGGPPSTLRPARGSCSC